MIIADVTYYPVGEGTSASKYVKIALDVFRRSGLKYYPNSMATVIEGETIEQVMNVIAEGEKAIVNMGIQRVETIIKIDHRLDRENTVEHKLSAISDEQ